MSVQVYTCPKKGSRNCPQGAAGMRIAGLGVSLPDRIITSDEVVEIMRPYLPPDQQDSTNADWIRQRTGIERRRVLRRGETLQPHIALASRRAMEVAQLKPEQIDYIICATVTPHTQWPTDAAWVAKALGIRAGGWDMEAACTSALAGLEAADALVRSGKARHVLLCAHDAMSLTANPRQRSLFPLFGDAATAMVISATETRDDLMRYIELGHYPEYSDIIGSSPVPDELRGDDDLAYNQGLLYVTMEGTEVYKAVRELVPPRIAAAMVTTGFRPTDFSVVAPHQANGKLTGLIFGERLPGKYGIEFADGVVVNNICNFGNTTAASSFLALAQSWLTSAVDAAARGPMPESQVMFVKFGGGFTYALAIVEWWSGFPEAVEVPWAADVARDVLRTE